MTHFISRLLVVFLLSALSAQPSDLEADMKSLSFEPRKPEAGAFELRIYAHDTQSFVFSRGNDTALAIRRGIQRSYEDVILARYRGFISRAFYPDKKRYYCHQVALQTYFCYRKAPRWIKDLATPESFPFKMYFEPTKTPHVGDLIVYYRKNVPRHVGVIAPQGMVLSKWGCISCYSYYHAPFCVPKMYGNRAIVWTCPQKSSWHTIRALIEKELILDKLSINSFLNFTAEGNNFESLRVLSDLPIDIDTKLWFIAATQSWSFECVKNFITLLSSVPQLARNTQALHSFMGIVRSFRAEHWRLLAPILRAKCDAITQAEGNSPDFDLFLPDSLWKICLTLRGLDDQRAPRVAEAAALLIREGMDGNNVRDILLGLDRLERLSSFGAVACARLCSPLVVPGMITYDIGVLFDLAARLPEDDREKIVDAFVASPTTDITECVFGGITAAELLRDYAQQAGYMIAQHLGFK